MKDIAASKLGITVYRKTFTFGELCFTLVRVLWDNADPDDPEFVGVIYVDQTGTQWLVTGGLRFEL